jgi:hypothetical protein
MKHGAQSWVLDRLEKLSQLDRLFSNKSDHAMPLLVPAIFEGHEGDAARNESD